MPTILVIDDNPSVATALDMLFSLHDLAAVHAASPEAGLALLDSEPVDLVIQDMNFSADTTSGDEGRALFAAIRQRHPDLPVVLLTAWTHLESAVELIKAGAADYVAKPWQDAKLLEQTGHVRTTPMLGLLAILHPEEVHPLVWVCWPVAGMPTNSPSWVPE